MNIDWSKLVFVFSSSVVLIWLMEYLLTHGLRNAGRTRKIYTLNEGPVFRVHVKQLAYSNLLVWGVVTWFISMIVLFESSKSGFLQIMAEWKGLFLFIIFLFAVIDLLLNFVLLRGFVKISPERIEYRFNSIKSIAIPVSDIKSIIDAKDLWQITLAEGQVREIHKSCFIFIQDSDKLEKILEEFSNMVNARQKL